MSSKLKPIQKTKLAGLSATVGQAVVGHERLIQRMLVCLLCRGHLLVEGLPGLAKTLSVKALAQALKLGFSRIQFTPDLLPADLTGSEIFDATSHKFTFEPGPLFHQLILADEINRAPAKVQSALLEAMGEGQISVGKTTYPMEQPFMVIATMNPIEQEGTYQLPEAQLDRFLLKTRVGYPSYQDELTIAGNYHQLTQALDAIKPLVLGKDIVEAQKQLYEVRLDPSLLEYCVRLVRATRGESEDTRFGRWIGLGAGPRASLALANCSRALAMLDGRDEVEPDDIREIAPDVFAHRLLLSFEAENDQLSIDEVIGYLLDDVRFY